MVHTRIPVVCRIGSCVDLLRGKLPANEPPPKARDSEYRENDQKKNDEAHCCHLSFVLSLEVGLTSNPFSFRDSRPVLPP
jgi:hypothetical protein